MYKRQDQLRAEFLLNDFVPKQRILSWDLESGKNYYVADRDDLLSFSERANVWQGRLSFEGENGVGQLFRVVHFVGDDKTADKLLLVAHHLLVDGISWRVISEDLLIAYQHLSLIHI